MYAEMIMREACMEESEEGVRIRGNIINDIRYVDDTTLAAESEDGLQIQIERVTQASGKYGLHLNLKKTKVMSNPRIKIFKVGGQDIEVVQYINLLGSIVDKNGGCQREVTRRLALGRATMSGLERLWKDRSISVHTKSRLVKSF